MLCLLEKVISCTPKEMFGHTSKYFQGEELDLMLDKGVFPYEYMDNLER